MFDQDLDLSQEEGALDAFLATESEITTLQTELSQMMDVTMALEANGVTTSSLQMLRATQLLSSTSLDAIATESMAGSRKETNLAMEALLDTIKEKAASWGAKIAHAAKEGSAKVLAVLNPLMTTVGGLITKLTSKAWDVTKAAGRKIKAHPVATVMTVVGAIAAVAGIMAYCGSSLPGGNATKEAFESFFKTVNDKVVKIPSFGTRKVEVVKTITKAHSTTMRDVYSLDQWRTFSWETVGTYKSVEELGWTASIVTQLGSKLDAAIIATRRGISAFGTRALKLTSDIGHGTFNKVNQFRRAAPQAVYNMTGSNEAAHATSFALGGIVYGVCISLVYAVWRLVKKVVFGGLRLIASTLRNLFSSKPFLTE